VGKRKGRDLMSVRQLYRVVLLPIVMAIAIVDNAVAQGTTTSTSLAAIPADNLAYPVLLRSGGGTGSGFFVNTSTASYLVTANHVLAENPTLTDPVTHQLRGDTQLEAISYSRDSADTRRNILRLNLQELQRPDTLRADATHDVVVITIGEFQNQPTADLPSSLTLAPGVTAVEVAQQGIVGVARVSIRSLNEVLIGNDVVMFGYPTSLGVPPQLVQQPPQLEPDRPLLRKGVVAGKNMTTHSIILDCPAYFGVSGGPVFEIDRELAATHFWLIGVVKEFVPLRRLRIFGQRDKLKADRSKGA
jgi:hypothetical protein